jgi:hypothetical protein
MPARIGLNLLKLPGNSTQLTQLNINSLNTTLNQGQQFRGSFVGGFNTMSMLSRIANSKSGCSSCGK